MKVIEELKKMGIYEQDDLFEFLDEIEKQTNQAVINQTKNTKNYSRKEMGLRKLREVYPSDESYRINKEINKVGKESSKTNGRKSRIARNILKTIASNGYYGYLVARKKLGITLEHPTLKSWYAGYLGIIPQLINPGGKIVLREGTYDLDSSISLQSKEDICIEGVGRATILKPTGDDTAIVIGDRAGNTPSTGIMVKDLLINGTNQSTQGGIEKSGDGCGVSLNGSGTKNNLVQNCTIENCGNDSIGGYETGTVLVSTNFVTGERGRSHGIHAHGAPNLFYVLFNHVWGMQGDGIRHGRIIAHNYVSRCGLGGIEYRNILGLTPYGIITGNFLFHGDVAIETWGEKTLISNNYIHQFAAHSDSALVLNKVDCLAEGNIIWYTVYGGSVKVSADRVSCVNNIIKGTRNNASDYSLKLDGASNCKIMGNSIVNPNYDGNTGTFYGILITGTSTYNKIKGNSIYTPNTEPEYGIAEGSGSDNWNEVDDNFIESATISKYNLQGANTTQDRMATEDLGVSPTSAPTGAWTEGTVVRNSNADNNETWQLVRGTWVQIV